MHTGYGSGGRSSRRTHQGAEVSYRVNTSPVSVANRLRSGARTDEQAFNIANALAEKFKTVTAKDLEGGDVSWDDIQKNVSFWGSVAGYIRNQHDKKKGKK